MHYLPVTAVEIPGDRLTIYLETRDGPDAIETELRFVTTAETPSYVAITETAIYMYPYPADDAEESLYGPDVLARARRLAGNFIVASPAKSRAQDFEVEEYLRAKGEEFGEEIAKLTERMINATLADRPVETDEAFLDLPAEKAYMDVLVKAAEAIVKLPEYRNTDGEMAKTMIIKRYIAENDLPIRNRNAHAEIKALIQAYYP